MNRLTLFLIFLILAGIAIGLYISYRWLKAQRQLDSLGSRLSSADRNVESLNTYLDGICPTKLIFLHHSVGQGFMYAGGLRDSLLELGVVARSCTYGDELGEQTDMNHWLPKFRNDIKRIIGFKAHPDKYYEDGATNDIIMFKSCFPNSNIVADGSEPGDATSSERTLANYKAVFSGLAEEFSRYPGKLFIFLTPPANVPAATTADQGTRARLFGRWLTDEFIPAYRAKTGLDNFCAYDLFAFLAGPDNFLRPEFRVSHPQDSHPNQIARKAIAGDFMKFFRPVLAAWRDKTSATSR